MIVAVVQCGASKKEHAALARDLYTGPLFRALSAAAMRIADRWYIASAKHGLIRPDKILAPYNVTLPANGDLAWATRVRLQLREFEPEGWDKLIALCSSRYLVGWADVLGAETPIKGLTIGRAISAAQKLRRT